MLKLLSIKNIALFEEESIDFKSNLTTITGNTGSGKSMILSCLHFVIGDKLKSSNILRPGTLKGHVIAVFDINQNKPILDLLSQQDIEVIDNQLIIRRTIDNNNRTKLYINDVIVNINFLKSISAFLIEIHGQNTNNNLVVSANHRIILDEFASLESDLGQLKSLYNNLKEQENKLAQIYEFQKNMSKEEDYLRFVQNELSNLNLEKGEEEDLVNKKSIIQKQGKIIKSLDIIRNALDDSESSIIKNIYIIEKELSKLNDEKSEEINKIIESVNIEVDEIAKHVDELYAKYDINIESIDQIEDRLYLLQTAARKYKVAIDDLPEYLNKVSEKLQIIDYQEDSINQCKEELAKAEKLYLQQAQKISELRQKYAVKMEKLVIQHLQDLAMNNTKFIIDFKERLRNEWHSSGIDNIEFLVSINKGMPLSPLVEVASGGELSRFMLSLKIVIAQKSTLPILIFDEVDTGIGGAVAEAIGNKLKELAKNVQIIMITHQPQVTAKADNHLYVEKNTKGEKTFSHAVYLNKEQSKQEIARMLAGSKITESALAAADSLLVGQ